MRDATIFDADVGINPEHRLLVDAIKVIIDQLVYFFFGKRVLRARCVIRPLAVRIGVLPVPVRVGVVDAVFPVMKTEIVLHPTLSRREFQFAFNHFDNLVKFLVIALKKQILGQNARNHDAVTAGPGPRGVHVGPKNHGLGLGHEIFGQFIAHHQHEVS